MWFELKRKLFHILGLIYIAALFFLPRPIYIGCTLFLLALSIAIELGRIKHDEFRAWYYRMFGNIVREEERYKFSGVFWMLLGVLATSILIVPNEIAATVLLYLILGDAGASIAGKALKGPHWPKSDKRLSGSFACFLICLLVGAIFLRPDYAWHGIIIAAVAAMLFELGVGKLNDNFLIPTGSSIVMMIVYKLPITIFHLG